MSIINVKWGKERIRLQFPDDPSTTPLRVVRDQLAEHTGLAADRFKLIKSGAIMKDNSAPLSAYGLTPGATIALMGSSDNRDERPAASSFGSAPKSSYGKSRPSEQSTLLAIHAEIESVRKSLQPAVTSFLSSVSEVVSGTLEPTTDTNTPAIPNLSHEAAKATHARLGESLLQALLRLDTITPESGWTEVRSARKGAVKEVQGLLDLLDDGWRHANLESDQRSA